MAKKSLRCCVTCAAPPELLATTGRKTNCFGATWTDECVNMRRVRSSSRAWICTTCGAWSRSFAIMTLAILSFWENSEEVKSSIEAVGLHLTTAQVRPNVLAATY